MKTTSLKQKVRIGTSIITALTIGTIGMILPHASTRVEAAEAQAKAAETQVQDLSSTCSIYGARYVTYVKGYTYTCYQVQAAVRCNNNSWYYGSPGKVSYAYCPNGTYAVLGAIRGKVRSTSPWSYWRYF
jgi:hypothetical protein